jgi:hypothetical protein
VATRPKSRHWHYDQAAAGVSGQRSDDGFDLVFVINRRWIDLNP